MNRVIVDMGWHANDVDWVVDWDKVEHAFSSIASKVKEVVLRARLNPGTVNLEEDWRQ